MSFQAKMFNRRAADPKYQPDRILEVLALQKGQVVADIGSGGGYFSFRFARAVGHQGRIYALDTNVSMLEYVHRSAAEQGFDNIETRLIDADDLPLPENALDVVFLRNVCHHLPDRRVYFSKIKQLLKLDGKVAIIEYKPGVGLFRRLFQHYVPLQTIIQEMHEAGYQIHASFDFLPDQSFTIFIADTSLVT